VKTTLELPAALMQRVKLRAVHRNQKLKDAIAQLLELGMACIASGRQAAARAQACAAEGWRPRHYSKY
jgi:hypothetical protein